MNCNNIQDELLLNGIKKDMHSHLADCSECREFSKIVESMNSSQQITGPSAELDKKILDYARDNRPSSRQPIPFHILTAVAAILVLGFLAFMSRNPSNQDAVNPGVAVKPVLENKSATSQKSTLELQMEAEEELADALETLWDDDVLNADITALEGELFVLSAELYSN